MNYNYAEATKRIIEEGAGCASVPDGLAELFKNCGATEGVGIYNICGKTSKL